MKKILFALLVFIAADTAAQQTAPGSRTGDTVIHKGFVRFPDMTTASNMTGKKVAVMDASGLLQWIIKDSVGGSGGGGSTSPGGSDTYVQFNDAGSFGGDAGFTYDKTTNILSTNNGAYRPTGSISFSDAGAGSVYRSSSDGLVLRAVTGSGYDLMIYDAAGNGVFGVETGTGKLGSTSQIGAGLLGYGSWNAWMNLRGGTTTNASLTIRDGVAPTSPAEGQIWRTTDKLYNVIQTGAATKEFTLNDIALTTGRIPYTTTNGRLTDTATFVRLPGGNVGINTTTPSVALDVVGDLRAGVNGTYTAGLISTDVATGFAFVGDGNGSGNGTAFLLSDAAQTFEAQANNGFTFYTGTVTIDNLSGGGAVTAGAGTGTLSVVSDPRVKHDINKYNVGLSQILRTTPITFRYNDSEKMGNGLYAGFNAQEVFDVYGSLGAGTILSGDKRGMHTLFDRAILGAQVNATKELYQMIQEQQKMIEELQKEIKKLKRK